MKLEIDSAACEGTGFCETACPQVFTLGADGIATVDPKVVASVSLADLEEVVDLCPTGAIRLRKEVG